MNQSVTSRIRSANRFQQIKQPPRVKTWGFSSAGSMVIPHVCAPCRAPKKKLGQDNPAPVDES